MENKKSLLVIDMLNDFVREGAPLKIPGVEKIIRHVRRETEKAHSEGYTVIYLCDSHDKNDREFSMFPPHAVKNTEGSKIIEELKPQGTDIIVRKSTFSAFFRTELDEVLKRLGVKKLMCTGVATSICVLYTVADAVMRGYKVDVVKDAVVGLNPEDHRFALKQMKEVLKVNII
jgi:nicotinamidase-related amidase